MNKPSNSQIMAYSHDKGPALLIAGPGSGKTFTIIERLKYLIQTLKIPSEEILVITFSKSAATELYKRYKQSLKSGTPFFGTFHSFAYQIIKNSGEFSNIKFINESKKIEFLSIILSNHGLIQNFPREKIIEFINEISRKKNLNSSYPELYFKENDFIINEIPLDIQNIILKDYISFLNERNLFDFDDMIILANKILRNNNRFLDKIRNNYKYILIDEFQDINLPQYELIKEIASPLNNIYAVGDVPTPLLIQS